MTDEKQTQTTAPPPFLNVITRRIQFTYTNWRGEVAVRIVEPTAIWIGSTEWHPEPQWLMRGTDTEKDVSRDFAMRDMKDVIYAE